MEESFLTEYVRADLEQIGYTTYAEVCQTGGGSRRCDMYGRIEDETSDMFGYTIAFEAKMSLNLKVLEQAYGWKNRANEVYVIVPATYKNMSSRKFARELCKLLGIGLMEVNVNSDKYNITVKSERCLKPKVPKLFEQQKQTLASNSSNTYVTPFKVTVLNMHKYFDDLGSDSELLIKLVQEIKHHYKTQMSAVRTIKTLIERNVIKGFYIVRENNKIVIKREEIKKDDGLQDHS